MLYRLFLYSTDSASVESPMIHRINNALIANTEEKWRRDGIAKDIKNFDTEHVIACIEKALTDPETGRCKCHPVVKYIPKQYKRKAFLYIATSYTMAAQMMEFLMDRLDEKMQTFSVTDAEVIAKTKSLNHEMDRM